MSVGDAIRARAAKYRADDEGRRWTDAHAAFWSRSAMKRRGWSGGMVRLLLGEPDRTIANPHDPIGAAACLYLRTRVMAAEASVEFRADREDASRRAESQRSKTR